MQYFFPIFFQVVDFLPPFMINHIRVITKSEEHINFFQFLSPFSYDLWGSIGLTLAVFAFVYWFILQINCEPIKKSTSFPSRLYMNFLPPVLRITMCVTSNTNPNVFSFLSLWIFWTALLQSSLNAETQIFELRLIFSAWLVFSLVIITSYTANLTVFLGIRSKTTRWTVKKVQHQNIYSFLLKCAYSGKRNS